MTTRLVRVMEILRYPKEADRVIVEIDGLANFHHVSAAPDREDARLQLEAGINAPALLAAKDSRRRPVVAIRSSPWKAGHETNPWHDEFDLDHGHVRYFGDHKVTTAGMPGQRGGNKVLLETWRSHGSTDRSERLLAPPLMLFRARPGYVNGERREKGFVEFCGVGLVERLEHVVQRDPKTGVSFPNLVIDIAVLDLSDSGDQLDWRWVDDRRDPALNAEETLRFAPTSWRRWVEQGRVAVPRIRRRVLSTRVQSGADQMPAVGSPDEAVLSLIYRYFDGRKHEFEQLAARVAGEVLGSGGNRYHEGWLTRAGGDGGLDFVGRLDVGTGPGSTPLIVLGQAKCVVPTTSINAEQVARVVARLQRGWIGVYVTTGSFSRQAQIEVIDDKYPLVLVSGGRLAAEVRRLAYASYGADVEALLAAVAGEYSGAVTSRRPEEVLLA